ncbi:MAG: hypothetical protein SGPRY_008326 [Prymnesium sp.]
MSKGRKELHCKPWGCKQTDIRMLVSTGCTLVSTFGSSAQLKEKDELVRRTYEEMKYFKLELKNREENFNKNFANHPRVGTINPLKGSASSLTQNESGLIGEPPGGKGRRARSLTLEHPPPESVFDATTLPPLSNVASQSKTFVKEGRRAGRAFSLSGSTVGM